MQYTNIYRYAIIYGCMHKTHSSATITVIVLAIFDTYMHHKLDVKTLELTCSQLHSYFQSC